MAKSNKNNKTEKDQEPVKPKNDPYEFLRNSMDETGLKIIWDIKILTKDEVPVHVAGSSDIPMGMYPPFFSDTLTVIRRRLEEITSPVYYRMAEKFQNIQDAIEDAKAAEEEDEPDPLLADDYNEEQDLEDLGEALVIEAEEVEKETED